MQSVKWELHVNVVIFKIFRTVKDLPLTGWATTFTGLMRVWRQFLWRVLTIQPSEERLSVRTTHICVPLFWIHVKGMQSSGSFLLWYLLLSNASFSGAQECVQVHLLTHSHTCVRTLLFTCLLACFVHTHSCQALWWLKCSFSGVFLAYWLFAVITSANRELYIICVSILVIPGWHKFAVPITIWCESIFNDDHSCIRMQICVVIGYLTMFTNFSIHNHSIIIFILRGI